MTRRQWTADELRVLDARFPHERTDDLARELGRPLRAVYQTAYTRGLHKSAAYLAGESARQLADGRSVSTRFAKGHATWNKGMRYEAGGRSLELAESEGFEPPIGCPIPDFEVAVIRRAINHIRS